MRTVCFSPWESSRYLRPIKELAPLKLAYPEPSKVLFLPYAAYKILLCIDQLGQFVLSKDDLAVFLK